jgi:phosphoglycolate phosphatase/pyrophosphatase PpaX
MRLRGRILDLDGPLGDTLPVCMQAFQRTFHPYLGQLFTAQESLAMCGPQEAGLLQRQWPQTWPQALDMSLADYARAHGTCRAPFPGLLSRLTTWQGRGVHRGIVPGKGPRSASLAARVGRLAAYCDGLEAGAAEGPVQPAGMRAFRTRWAATPAEGADGGAAP